MTGPRITFVCSECGGKNVSSDATARWSDESQEWELSSVDQNEYCDDCDGETHLVEKPLE